MTTEVKRLSARDDEHSKDGLAFEVSSPVNVAQLEEEIKEATGWRSPAGLVLDGGRIDEETGLFGPLPEGEASEGVKTTLTVTHDNIDAKVVARVIRDHEPVPARAPAGKVDAQSAIERAEAGMTLTPEELTAVVTHLLAERAQG